MTSSRAVPAPAVDAEVARTLRLGGGARARRIALRVVLAGIALAIAVVAVRWWQQRSQRPAPAFVTAPIERGELAITVTATGTLEARNLVAIGSEVSGRIHRVLVDANDRVVAGQVLAEIDPEPLAAQVAQVEAQLAQARAQLAQARATRRETRQARTRVEGLVASGVAAEQDLDAAVAAADRATASVTLAGAAVAQASAALRLARSNLARTALRSPIDGVVLSRDVEVGQTVVASFQSPVLFQIAGDLRAMKASVDVDEADVGLVHEGENATFTVAAYLGRTFDARVVAVHNAARLVDRVVTYEAELDVDNADLALRPGMTVTAEIVARRIPDALMVPGAALRFAPAGEPAASGGNRIWILRDGRPVAIEVEIVGQNDTLTAIAAPELEPGAPVIVNTK
jgi:HlyD family secretion protein